MPQFLDYSDADFEAQFSALLNAKREDSPDVDAVVADIIADVRAQGDAAVIALTKRFDRIALTPETLRITPKEIDDATVHVDAADREALEMAATRIRAYHARQMPEDAQWTDEAGATLLAMDACVCGGALCARRFGELPIFRADERDPGQSGWCGEACDHGADAGWGAEPARFVGCPDCRGG